MTRSVALVSVGESLWSGESQQRLPGGWQLPTRMVVARLGDGSVLLHSPIAIDAPLAAQISEIGPVAHLVAPSRMHDLHQPGALARFPGARLYAAPHLGEKHPDFPIAETLGDQPPCGLRDDFDTALIDGAPSLSEVAFFHRLSRSLIVVDLVFNVREPLGLLTSIILFTVGANRRLAQSRAWRLAVKDPERYRSSLRRVLAWPFERVVMAHGDVITKDAREVLTAALARTHGFGREKKEDPSAVGPRPG